MRKLNVLFVCTGNTCRSPMAAALASDIWAREGIPAAVSSAGIYAGNGDYASPHSRSVIRRMGLNLDAHQARQVTAELLRGTDLVLTMTAGHKVSLVRMFPGDGAKVYTLGEYAMGSDDAGADVDDPFGMSETEYKTCAEQIREMVIKCAGKMKERDIMGNLIDEKLHVTKHPLVQSKITMLRSVETGNKEFRELVGEIATLICYEATHDIALHDVKVETPVGVADGKVCCQKFGIVPILRAGLGMADGILRLLPTAKVGHIGLYRDPESLKPVEYYCKLPHDSAEREIFLLDPMLATGGTAAAAIGYLKRRGVKRIRFLCLLAVEEGVRKIHSEHPDVDIYTAAYDRELNDHGYIIPGLGDAGDRLFGTK